MHFSKLVDILSHIKFLFLLSSTILTNQMLLDVLQTGHKISRDFTNLISYRTHHEIRQCPKAK